MSAPWTKARLGCAALCCAAALTVTACSASSAEVAPTTSAPSAQESAAAGVREQSAAERDNLEQIGADYAAALAANGLPLPPSSTHATLAQIARGICGQLSAGTSEAEIRAQLRPFSLYAVSLAGGDLDEEQAGQAYLDTAVTQVC